MMSQVWHNDVIPGNNKEYIQVPYHWFFVREIHQPVEAHLKGPVSQNVFPCHDVF